MPLPARGRPERWHTAAMTTIAVLGTGIMGAPMARKLAEAGNDVRVWNRTRAKADALADVAAVADEPSAAVDGADIILTMLLDADAVREVLTAAEPEEGQTWLQMSTVGEDIDGLVTLAAEHGLALVDAPVLGTKPTAEQGALTVLAASRTVDEAAVAPLFDAVGGRTVWLDEPGQASRLKLVINTWVVGLLGVLGDTIALADAATRAGLPARVITAVRAAFDAAIEAGHADDDMAAVVEAARP